MFPLVTMNMIPEQAAKISELLFSSFLSIHLNYLNDETYYGTQVFYEDQESLTLAQVMKKTLNKFFQFFLISRKVCSFYCLHCLPPRNFLKIKPLR